jgi:hypothetical protein
LYILTGKLSELLLSDDLGPVPEDKGCGVFTVLSVDALTFAELFFEIIRRVGIPEINKPLKSGSVCDAGIVQNKAGEKTFALEIFEEVENILGGVVGLAEGIIIRKLVYFVSLIVV